MTGVGPFAQGKGGEGKPVSRNEGRGWVYGVDFSGARDAGKRAWIARCSITEGALNLVDLFQATSLPGSGRARELSHNALVGFIGNQEDAIFGLDFPFSLPWALLGEASWKEFVLGFAQTYPSPEDFPELCRARAEGRELKRTTDIESRAPFSPYNLRVFRQTYFGIRDVLAPLVKTDRACILPMQRPCEGKAWVIEICPASTLKREHLSTPYKGRTEKRKAARQGILESLEEHLQLKIAANAMRSNIIDDNGGDALDSVIAALAAFKAFRSSFALDALSPYEIEGWVYV
jgi:hypothetical protein